MNSVNVSDVTPSTSKCATVHGLVLGELSPVKTNSKNREMKYFDGWFGDEKKSVRLVSFDASLRSKLEDIRRSGGRVALQNCMIKRKAATDDFELQINNKSIVTNSPKKFKVSENFDARNAASQCAQVKSIDVIKDLMEHQEVSLTGKVASLSKVEELVKKSS